MQSQIESFIKHMCDPVDLFPGWQQWGKGLGAGGGKQETPETGGGLPGRPTDHGESSGIPVVFIVYIFNKYHIY